VFCVGMFCGSDLFTGVCVCACVVLYIVFRYALFVCAYHMCLVSACQSAEVPV
jgi:hypothetical protein